MIAIISSARIVCSQREARGRVTLKVSPSYRACPLQCEIYLRTLFDYDPSRDELIPCPQAGISFLTGDVLQVLCKDDHHWWQARRVGQIRSGLPLLTSGAHSSGTLYFIILYCIVILHASTSPVWMLLEC